MTIEDRIQASLVHHADSVPELHGLGPLVVARARTVQRRRRTGAAAGAVAVAAGALAVVLHGTGPHHDAPGHPSPKPSPSPVTTAAPASSFAPRSTPPPFELDLPTGPPLSQPALLMTNKVQLSVVRAGVEHQLGLLTAGVTGAVVNAGAGIVFQSGDSVDLVSPSNALSQLMDEPGLRGFTVSRDGHYLAWGRTVTGGSGALTGELGLYDLQTLRPVSTLVLAQPGTPTGFLGDARVAVDTDDGTHLGALLWTPAGGGLARLPAKATGVDPLSPSQAVVREGLDRCATYLLDTASQQQTPVHGCLDPRQASPDGTRFVGLDNGNPVIVDRATGHEDSRLATLFSSKAIVADRVTWLDDDHLALQASSRLLDDQGQPYGKYRYLLTCAVPTSGQVPCGVSAKVGPYDLARPGPTSPLGPLPFLAVDP